MELRQRERDHEPLPGGGAPEGPAGLEAIRHAADALLAAGDRAIERALSGDSRKFNEATRQQGGQ